MAKKKAAKKNGSANGNGKKHGSQQSVNGAVKSICDIMRRSNCAGAMQYVPELTWILFLRILDERETHEAEHAEAVGADFHASLKAPYRWQDWATPDSKRREELLTQGKVLDFVNGELLPYLRGLRTGPTRRPARKSSARFYRASSGCGSTRKRTSATCATRCMSCRPITWTIRMSSRMSQLYEGLLLHMGEKKNDGGQFFTPREIIRLWSGGRSRRSAKRSTIPAAEPAVFWPSRSASWPARTTPTRVARPVGTIAARYVLRPRKENHDLSHRAGQPGAARHRPAEHLARQHAHRRRDLRRAVRERAGTIRRGDDQSAVRRQGRQGSPNAVRLQDRATQVLFLQHVMDSLQPDRTVRHRARRRRLVPHQRNGVRQTKRKLLDECNLYCVVSLPGGVFDAARSGREDESAVLQQGRADREDLVLRPVRHQSRQAPAVHARQVRRLLPACCPSAGQRAKLDRRFRRPEAESQPPKPHPSRNRPRPSKQEANRWKRRTCRN